MAFYVSLVGPLMGCYLQVADAPSELHLRAAMNLSKLRDLWCSVYISDQMPEVTSHDPRPSVFIPVRFDALPKKWHEYERVTKYFPEPK